MSGRFIRRFNADWRRFLGDGTRVIEGFRLADRFVPILLHLQQNLGGALGVGLAMKSIDCSRDQPLRFLKSA